MVFTNEPGIYISPDALDYRPVYMNEEQWEKFKIGVRAAFEKYKGIGVSIEDDMLVTADGVRWMTEALPRRMSEIEAFIAQGRRSGKAESRCPIAAGSSEQVAPAPRAGYESSNQSKLKHVGHLFEHLS